MHDRSTRRSHFPQQSETHELLDQPGGLLGHPGSWKGPLELVDRARQREGPRSPAPRSSTRRPRARAGRRWRGRGGPHDLRRCRRRHGRAAGSGARARAPPGRPARARSSRSSASVTSVPRARLRSATERMPSTALETAAAAPVRWVRVSPSKASTSSPTSSRTTSGPSWGTWFSSATAAAPPRTPGAVGVAQPVGRDATGQAGERRQRAAFDVPQPGGLGADQVRRLAGRDLFHHGARGLRVVGREDQEPRVEGSGRRRRRPLMSALGTSQTSSSVAQAGLHVREHGVGPDLERQRLREGLHLEGVRVEHGGLVGQVGAAASEELAGQRRLSGA